MRDVFSHTASAGSGPSVLGFTWEVSASGGRGADLIIRARRPLRLVQVDADVTAVAASAGPAACRVLCAVAHSAGRPTLGTDAATYELLPASPEFGPIALHNPLHLNAGDGQRLAQGLLAQVALGFWAPASRTGAAQSRAFSTRPELAFAPGDCLVVHVGQRGLAADIGVALTCAYTPD